MTVMDLKIFKFKLGDIYALNLMQRSLRLQESWRTHAPINHNFYSSSIIISIGYQIIINMTTHRRETQMDKQVQAAMGANTTGDLLQGDAIELLDNIDAILRDDSVSQNKRLAASASLRKLIIPLLQASGKEIIQSSQTLAPIASVGYAQKRTNNKKKRQRKKVFTEEFVSEAARNIFFYLEEKRQESENKEKEDLVESPPTKKTRVLAVATPSPPRLIATVDRAYTRVEAAKLLSATQKYTKARGAMMRDIVSHQQKYDAPCCERTLHRLMSDFDDGKLIYGPFTDSGRPPFATDHELEQALQNFQQHNGKSLTRDDVKEIICKVRNNRLEAAGYKVLTEGEVSDQTVSNYTAYIAIQPEISISVSTQVKTTTRHAAENSIRGAISLLAIIASTHFIPVREHDPSIIKQVKELAQTNPEIVQLMDLVNKELGIDMFPVQPQYLYSTDDTTEYIYEGTKKDTPKFVLTSKKSISERGTKSVHRVEDNKSMSGMRVKLTFTFSAAGTCLPLVVTVAGLSDRELPGDDFVHVEVPGLCVGGGGVNVKNQSVGHLLFMKNTPGAEKKRFAWYQKHILIRGVNDHRKHFAGFDAGTGQECPDELTAVSWCDGDLSQIHAITNGTDELTANKIIANKQHAARSAVEQPADLTKVFKLIKLNLPHHSVADISSDMCPMKKLLMQAFNDVLECVHLPSAKRRHLIDFLCVLPDILNKCCTQKHIRQGFVEAGMIDNKHYRYPVFNKILATCRRNIEQSEYDLVNNHFGEFFEEASRDGIVSERIYNELGVRVDKDMHDKDVLRDCGISNESRQRSKCLTHHQQVQLREDRLWKLRLEANQSKLTANHKHQQLIAKADEAEKILLNKFLHGVDAETDQA